MILLAKQYCVLNSSNVILEGYMLVNVFNTFNYVEICFENDLDVLK
jgi:hypothetical protein